jgi:hypothetical protein
VHRHLLALLAVVAFGLSAAAPAPAAATTPCVGEVVDGRWRSVPAPELPHALHETGGVYDFRSIRAMAVDPLDPSRMVVTNGKAIAASTNAGCDWEVVFEVGSTPAPELPTQPDLVIQQLVVAEAGTVVARAVDVSSGSRHGVGPVILRGVEREWSAERSGLPSLAAPQMLAAAPSDPRTLYLLLNQVQDRLPELYASTDGGASWSRRGPLPFGELGIEPRVVVDPGDADAVWVAGSFGLASSGDGGRSWALADVGLDRTSTVDVHARRDAPSRVLVFEAGHLADRQARSDDGGRTWQLGASPVHRNVFSVATGRGPDDIVVVTRQQSSPERNGGARVWRHEPETDAYVEITPSGEPVILDLVADRTPAPRFHGFSPDRVFTYTGPEAEGSGAGDDGGPVDDRASRRCVHPAPPNPNLRRVPRRARRLASLGWPPIGRRSRSTRVGLRRSSSPSTPRPCRAWSMPSSCSMPRRA